MTSIPGKPPNSDTYFDQAAFTTPEVTYEDIHSDNPVEVTPSKIDVAENTVTETPLLNTTEVRNITDFSNLRYREELNAVFKSMAMGSFDHQLRDAMYGFDRFDKNPLPTNTEYIGYTFITRPTLNLQDPSLNMDRYFAPLKTNVPNSMAYAIRGLLDCYWASTQPNISHSKLLDASMPFMTPLSNALLSISGFQDPVMETQTTPTGFHSEDFTAALGHDYLNKTYTLNLTFTDYQYGPILAIFNYWFRYIANVLKNVQVAYSDDINERRLNYTCSIYRFVMDPRRRIVTGYAKATGCIPVSTVNGAKFNYGENEHYISSSGKFTIPFTVNKLEYDDFGILMDFNRLMDNFNPKVATAPVIPNKAHFNFKGYPYIDTSNGHVELQFRHVPNN